MFSARITAGSKLRSSPLRLYACKLGSPSCSENLHGFRSSCNTYTRYGSPNLCAGMLWHPKPDQPASINYEVPHPRMSLEESLKSSVYTYVRS
jgi:hypothetical protein